MPLCNRMFCCIFGWYFYIEIRLKYEKQIFCPGLELFHCLPPLFCCLPLWKTVRLDGKKQQNATNMIFDATFYFFMNWFKVFFQLFNCWRAVITNWALEWLLFFMNGFNLSFQITTLWSFKSKTWHFEIKFLHELIWCEFSSDHYVKFYNHTHDICEIYVVRLLIFFCIWILIWLFKRHQ